MPIILNLRELAHDTVEMVGELSLDELGLDIRDAMIQVKHPLHYDLEIEALDDSLLVQGALQLTLECQCVRCLQPFVFDLELEPWTQYLPLTGEEAVPIKLDSVDLTPLVREDILLEFPQHPLCRPDCSGTPSAKIGKVRKIVGKAEAKPSAWAELNKLKL